MPPNKVKKAERLYEKIKEAHISSVLELQKKIKGNRGLLAWYRR